MSRQPHFYQDYSSDPQYVPLQTTGHFQGAERFRDSYNSGFTSKSDLYDSSKNGSAVALNESDSSRIALGDTSSKYYGDNGIYTYPTSKKSHKRKWTIIGVLIALALIGGGVGAGVYFYNHRNDSDGVDGSGDAMKDTNGDGLVTNEDDNEPIRAFKTGIDGSSVTMENGQSFIYRNSFGGSWDEDPNSFKAKAQSYTPPLEEEFNYATDRILGV